MAPELRLDAAMPGQTVCVKRLDSRGSMRRRLMDIGFIEGEYLTCVGVSPLGDPKAFLVRGAVIALRAEDCERIVIV